MSYDYYLDMYLRGYKIMSFNMRHIDNVVRLREAKKRFDKFCSEFREHQKAIAEYFRAGIEAEVFNDGATGRVLRPQDDIWTMFADGKYQYTLRRQPL